MAFLPLTAKRSDLYYTGRADADDDSNTLTTAHMTVRASYFVDESEKSDLDYALGYMDRLLELRMENAAVTAAETELAHTPLPAVAR
jgi:hypothetical protein